MSINFNDVFNSSQLNINNPKLEELLNKTKDVAEAVGKKSAEHLEISRLRLEALDTKTKLAKAYERFGKLKYNELIGEEIEESQLDTLAADISSLKDKLDMLNIQIEESKQAFSE